MNKKTLMAVKALSRKELKLPPSKIEKLKKVYQRHSKHRTAHHDDAGPSFF